MTAAIFGLIGVLVGALISAREARRATNRIDARAAEAAGRAELIARRLVDDELWRASATLKGHGPGDPVAAVGMIAPLLDLTTWQEHRQVLATVLNDEDWTAVHSVCTALQIQAVALRGLAAVAKPRHTMTEEWFAAFALVDERIPLARRALSGRELDPGRIDGLVAPKSS